MVIVELTADGDLRMPPSVAEQYFPHGALVPLREESELLLLPIRGAAAGGLLLKQRTAVGGRSVLVRESLGTEFSPGRRPAIWDESRGALRVSLEALR